jgi:K+-transporting ATPase ATPase C chain
MFTAVSLVVVGAYHVVLWGIGAAVFSDQASGSLIRRADGTVVGSELIAQKFASPAYFQPRPSAVDYNAASTGGSNYGPSNPDHLKAVKERLDATMALEAVRAGDVPSEMVTASGAGLDPHVPPAGALMQVNRVAAARGVPADRVRALVEASIEPPQLGFLGRARVNVLTLNLALDEAVGPPRPQPPSVSR